jgi:ribonuclease T2
MCFRVRRTAYTVATAFSFMLIFSVVVLAEDSQQTLAPAGRFDFYVLALSWSPSYCESAKQRTPNRKPPQQCSGQPLAFVVHGLWPQFSQGFPSYCQQPAPRIDSKLVKSMLDLMPSRQLIYAEWNRHGTCSGLTAQGFFDTLRKARTAVTIPAAYRNPAEPLTVSPADVTAAFVKANPGLTADEVMISCGRTRLTEVRLCLDKDLSFRTCGAVARRTCRHKQIVMPAARGE